MNGKTMLMAALVGLVVVSLSACGGSSSKKGGGGGGSSLPTVPAIGWWLNGGTGVDGGNAGGLVLQAGNSILEDDGRTRPDVTTNFLAPALLAGNVVDWAELVGLLTPTGTDPDRVFSLPAGTGFQLPAGATLDLSGVPTGVDNVSFSTDSPINVAGNMVTTRTGDRAVSVYFITTSTNPAALVYTGWFDGRGDNGQEGGDLVLDSAGGMVFLGGGNTSGGSDNTGLNGGDGGTVDCNAQGDLITRVFGIEANGGEGVVTGMVGGSFGGHGGWLEVWATEIEMPVRWGLFGHGGHGELDAGGNAGGIEIFFEQGELDLWVRVIGNGGNGADGTGGRSAGFVALGGDSNTFAIFDNTTIRGTVYVTGMGGDSVDNNAATGSTGYLELWAETVENANLVGDFPGGHSTNDHGGRGGSIGVYGRNLTNIQAALTSPGGNGGTFGGLAGRIDFAMYPISGQAGTAGTATGITAVANGNGGNSVSDTAGSGASVALEVHDLGASYTVSGVSFSGIANGGNSSGVGNAGSGGEFRVSGSTGSYAATFNATANGGTATGSGNGGTGGALTMEAAEADISLVVNSSSINGGNGVGNGGEGGSLIVNGDLATGGDASATATINSLSARGGNSTGTGNGGGQGYVELTAGGTGVLTVPVFNVDARAGDSAQGHGGGNSNRRITFYTRGGGSVGGGTVNLSGGSGATQSGNGDGRAASGLWIDVEGPLFTVNLNYTANGGNAGGTGTAGYGQAVDVNLNSSGGATEGSVTMTGTYTSNGGNGATQAGGSPGWFRVVGGGAATTGGTFTFTGTYTATGGNLGGGVASSGGYIYMEILGNIVINGSITMTGATADTGADGSNFTLRAEGSITISGTLRTIAGGGGTTGGDGGTINIGNIDTGVITVTASAVIQANGGAGSMDGDGGTIIFTNATADYTNVSGTATIETLDGSGTDTGDVNFIV